MDAQGYHSGEKKAREESPDVDSGSKLIPGSGQDSEMDRMDQLRTPEIGTEDDDDVDDGYDPHTHATRPGK